MYERFTDRARKAMQLANQEAQRLCHEYIAPVHILIGIVKERDGVAMTIMKKMGKELDLKTIRDTVVPGPDKVIMGRLPQTPSAKKVIEQAIEAARSLNNNYIGTEHLFLGLLQCEEILFLLASGVTADMVREEIKNMMTKKMTSDPLQQQPLTENHMWSVFINPEGNKATITLGDAMKLVPSPSLLIDVVMNGTKNTCLKIIGEHIIEATEAGKGEVVVWLKAAYKQIEETV